MKYERIEWQKSKKNLNIENILNNKISDRQIKKSVKSDQ